VVEPVVLIVAVAPPDGCTDCGLIWHVGDVPGVSEVITQVRLTVPLKLLSAPRLIVAEDASPGATAKGLKGAKVMLKSCPNAEGRSARNAAMDKTKRLLRRFGDFILKFDDSDLNMSGFGFK